MLGLRRSRHLVEFFATTKSTGWYMNSHMAGVLLGFPHDQCLYVAVDSVIFKHLAQYPLERLINVKPASVGCHLGNGSNSGWTKWWTSINHRKSSWIIRNSSINPMIFQLRWEFHGFWPFWAQLRRGFAARSWRPMPSSTARWCAAVSSAGRRHWACYSELSCRTLWCSLEKHGTIIGTIENTSAGGLII